METQILLRCVKDYGKLRVRIFANGYSSEANCQFPRNLRKEGREFYVPKNAITFSQGAGANRKFFYRINKNLITCKDDLQISVTVIYEDEDTQECNICMSEDKSIVFVPCGHYCCCNDCSSKIKICPMCRASISQKVRRDEL